LPGSGDGLQQFQHRGSLPVGERAEQLLSSEPPLLLLGADLVELTHLGRPPGTTLWYGKHLQQLSYQ